VKRQIARIITDQMASGDHATTDALRRLAGMPIRQAQQSRHASRSRVVQIHRDGLGNVIGSTELIEEHIIEDQSGSWSL
jgi:hypothetical protein